MNRVRYKIFLLLFVCICLPVTSVWAADTYYTEGFFQYSIHGDSVSIHSYYGIESEVVIPDHIAALPVTEIESEAFSGDTTVTKITIPDTVTNVGNGAFSNVPGLKTIVNQSESLELEVPESVVIQEDYPVYVNPDDYTTADNTQASANETANPGSSVIGFETVAEEMDDIPSGIDAGSGTYVTVDNTGNLVSVDTENNITVIDRDHDYTLKTDEYGTTIIVDENENQVQVSDDGQITCRDNSGNSITKNTEGEIVSEDGRTEDLTADTTEGPAEELTADAPETDPTGADLTEADDTDQTRDKGGDKVTDKEKQGKTWKGFAVIGIVAVIAVLLGIYIWKRRKNYES